MIIHPQHTITRPRLTPNAGIHPSEFFQAGQGGLVYHIQDIKTLYSDVGKTTLASVDGNVAAIADIINGHDATQGTGVQQGKLRQTAGGIYYIEFDGADDFYSIPVAAWNQAKTHYAAWVKYSSGSLRIITTGDGSGKNVRTFATATTLSVAATTDEGGVAQAEVADAFKNVDLIIFIFVSHDGATTTTKLRAVSSTLDLSSTDTASGVMITPDRVDVGQYAAASIFSAFELYGSVLRRSEFTATEQSRIISYFRSQGANV